MRRVNFIFIFSEQAAWGGGGGGTLPDFSFFIFFPCSADHERDRPPYKVVFFRVGNQCAECEKQQQTTTTTVVFSIKNLDTSRPSEHPGGIIGCKDKRAPMIVT